MLKHKQFFLRLAVLILCICLLLPLCSRIFTVKYLYVPDWPKSDPFHNFYDLPENSLDLLILGSSHTMDAVIPQALYDDFGIRSYNLSSEQQSLIISYYWLKEALRFQKPQAVVLDVYMTYPFQDQPLNGIDTWLHRPMTPMRWSPVKREAVREICRQDPAQSPWNYYLPFLRFHSRWSELKPEDFLHNTKGHMSPLHGFIPALHAGAVETQTLLSPDPTGAREAPLPVMLEYLDRITALCKDQGIRLVLLFTPYQEAAQARYRFFADYAGSHGLDFLDYNTLALSEACGFSPMEDFKDEDHLNLWGARKLTAHLGQFLTEQMEFPGIPADYLEDSREYYRHVVKNSELSRIQTLSPYLDRLEETEVLIFYLRRQVSDGEPSEEVRQKMEALGFPEEVFSGAASVGLLRRNAPVRGSSAGWGKIPGAPAFYSLDPDASTARLDSVTYAFEPCDLQLLLWDPVTQTVIDTPGFDFLPEGTAVR